MSRLVFATTLSLSLSLLALSWVPSSEAQDGFLSGFQPFVFFRTSPPWASSAESFPKINDEGRSLEYGSTSYEHEAQDRADMHESEEEEEVPEVPPPFWSRQPMKDIGGRSGGSAQSVFARRNNKIVTEKSANVTSSTTPTPRDPPSAVPEDQLVFEEDAEESTATDPSSLNITEPSEPPRSTHPSTARPLNELQVKTEPAVVVPPKLPPIFPSTPKKKRRKGPPRYRTALPKPSTTPISEAESDSESDESVQEDDVSSLETEYKKTKVPKAPKKKNSKDKDANPADEEQEDVPVRGHGGNRHGHHGHGHSHGGGPETVGDLFEDVIHGPVMSGSGQGAFPLWPANVFSRLRHTFPKIPKISFEVGAKIRKKGGKGGHHHTDTFHHDTGSKGYVHLNQKGIPFPKSPIVYKGRTSNKKKDAYKHYKANRHYVHGHSTHPKHRHFDKEYETQALKYEIHKLQAKKKLAFLQNKIELKRILSLLLQHKIKALEWLA